MFRKYFLFFTAVFHFNIPDNLKKFISSQAYFRSNRTLYRTSARSSSPHRTESITPIGRQYSITFVKKKTKTMTRHRHRHKCICHHCRWITRQRRVTKIPLALLNDDNRVKSSCRAMRSCWQMASAIVLIIQLFMLKQTDRCACLRFFSRLIN